MKHRASSTHRMDAPDRHDGQTDLSLCPFVLITCGDIYCLSLPGANSGQRKRFIGERGKLQRRRRFASTGGATHDDPGDATHLAVDQRRLPRRLHQPALLRRHVPRAARRPHHPQRRTDSRSPRQEGKACPADARPFWGADAHRGGQRGGR